MRRAILLLAAALAILAVGCGGDDSTSADADDDQAAIESTINTWLFEGDCDVMTDKFLQAQTFESDPDKACDLFETAFAEPLYSEDDVEITDVQVVGDKATAVVGGGGSDITSTYTLVRVDGEWRIDAAELD